MTRSPDAMTPDDGWWYRPSSGVRVPPIFRAEFDVPEGGRAGRVVVAAMGFVVVSVDGVPVTEDQLLPGQSAPHVMLTRTFSVPLTPGRSAIAVELGHGFFDVEVASAWDWHLAPGRARPAFALRLTVDDEPVRLAWRTSTGGTRFDSIFEGETFDAAHEPEGWRLPGFDDTGWAPAERRHFDGELRAATHDPVRVIREHPVLWRRLGKREWLGDVGRVIAGWPEIPAGAGTTVVVASEKLVDGVPVEDNRTFVDSERFQRFEATDPASPWQPKFTWAGYRYLHVFGPEAEPRVRALEVRADVDRTGEYACSDETLTWWHEAFVRTVETNLHTVPTDTPTYEKNGWSGDAKVGHAAMLHTLDVGRTIEGFLDQLADTQRPTGELAVIAPTAGWGYAGCPCSPAPEWTSTLAAIACERFAETGDPEPFLRRLPTIDRWAEYELGQLDDEGLAVSVLGDYLAPGTCGPADEDHRLTATSILADAFVRVAETCDWLGGRGRADEYRGRAVGLVEAMNARFLDAEAGEYAVAGEYRQSAAIVPLALGQVPDECEDRVFRRLVEDLRARDGRHHTGHLGNRYLYQLLAERGQVPLAIQVATNPEGPSFERWRRQGHGTLLEYWTDDSRSHAHYFQGSGLTWLYESLAGIRRRAPGWAEAEVRPLGVGHLERLRCRRVTPRGDIVVEWRDDDLRVEVPPGIELSG